MTVNQQRSRIDLGKANRRSVLAEILYHAPIARTKIADRTGLTGASVSRITRDLINAGLVLESSTSIPQNRSGRRLIELVLNPQGAYLLGISINAFAQSVSLCGLDNKIICSEQLELESVDDPQQVLDRVVQTAQKIIRDNGIDQRKLLGGGIAIGGAVEPKSGRLLFSSTMDWGELEITPMLTKQLGIPICIETVPNALNLAQTRFGITKGQQNVVMINASLRMGASLLLDNQLRRGVNFSAGQIGKLCLQQSKAANQSPLALDDVAAGIAVLDQCSGEKDLRSGRRAADTLIQLKSQSIQGDRQISDAFYQAGQHLSQTIQLIDTLLQPQTILLAGPMSSVPSYIKGVVTAFENATATGAESEPKANILVSDMPPEQAVLYLAFNEFLALRDIDLTTLNNAGSA